MPPPRRAARAPAAELFSVDSRLAAPGVSAMIEVILKNDGRGRGVEARFPLAPVALAQRQPRFGFMAGQALVLQDHRQARHARELRGEGADDRRLVAVRSVQ